MPPSLSDLQQTIRDLALQVRSLESRVAMSPRAVQPSPTSIAGDGGAAEAWADVSMAWAEYMTQDGNGTIPMELVGTNAVSGEHWSSRWWAHRASEIVSGFESSFYHYYLGPRDVPPKKDPNNNDLALGCIYYNSVEGQMYVWDGLQWQPISSGSGGGSTFAGIAYSEFQYTSQVAGETTFGGADNYGNVPPDFTDPNTNTNVYVNGVRLVERENWYVLNSASIELVRGVAAGSSVTVECYGVSDSAGSLVPSATTHLRCDYAAVSAGQTNFSGVDNYGRTLKGLMIPGAIIDVHVNGVLLEESGYTVVSDSELALVRGVSLGSAVSIEVMTVAGDSGGVVAEHDHDCGEFI